jgi:hypothetical protein
MSYRTVGDVKEYAAQMLHEDETDAVLAGSTAEGTHNLLDRWFTKSVARLWGWRIWNFLTDSIELTWTGPTSSEAEGAVLYLPNYVNRILSVYPQSANTAVELIESYEFDRLRPNIRNRDLVVVHGFYGVEADNPSAGTLTATSSAGAGDNGLQVRIEGLTNASPGYELVETLTLAGAGTATTTNAFKAGVGGVYRIYIVPSTTAYTGIITVTRGSTTLERLDAARETAHEHIRTEMFAPISGTGTYTVRFYRKPPDPVNADDVIQVPEHYHDLIELMMQRELERFRGNHGTVIALEAEWRGRVRELQGWDNRKPGHRRRLTVVPQWGNGADRWRG